MECALFFPIYIAEKMRIVDFGFWGRWCNDLRGKLAASDLEGKDVMCSDLVGKWMADSDFKGMLATDMAGLRSTEAFPPPDERNVRLFHSAEKVKSHDVT